MNKVVVIGLDGATFKILDKAFELGYMPNILKLVKQGIRKELIAPIPAESPISWPVIVTGCNPGKIGIYGWYDFESPLQLKIESSRKIKGKAVWDILGSYGLKSIIINVPMTYPPYAINGIMVSGFPCPYNSIIAYPPYEQWKLRKYFPNYKIEPTKIALDYAEVNEEDFLKEVTCITKMRTDLCLYLMENYKWDFLFIVYTELDRVQHVFYEDNICAPRSRLLLKYLQFLDKSIGRIIDSLTEDITIIIISDHGFEKLEKYIAINNFLESKGYLKRISKYIPQKWQILTLLRRLRMPLTYQIALKILRKFPNIGGIIGNFDQRMDMVKTKAYCPDLGYICVKDKELLNSLLKELYNLRDPENQKKVIKRVYKREEIFSGPFLKSAPNLLVIPEEGYEPRAWGPSIIFPKEFLSPHKRGTHYGHASRSGIFIFHSRIYELNGLYDNVRAEDITPTILSLFDIPASRQLNGRTLISRTVEIPSYNVREKIKFRLKRLRNKLNNRRNMIASENDENL